MSNRAAGLRPYNSGKKKKTTLSSKQGPVSGHNKLLSQVGDEFSGGSLIKESKALGASANNCVLLKQTEPRRSKPGW